MEDDGDQVKKVVHTRMAFSVAEVAQMLGVSARMLWTELKEGRLPHTPLRRRRVITLDQINTYLRQNSSDFFDAKKIAADMLTSTPPKRKRQRTIRKDIM